MKFRGNERDPLRREWKRKREERGKEVKNETD